MPTAAFKASLNHSVKVSRRVDGGADQYGHPAITYATLFAGLSCHFWSEQGRQRREPQGDERVGDWRLLTHGTVGLLPADRIEPVSGIVGFTLGEVTWVKGIMGLDGATHHLEAEVRAL